MGASSAMMAALRRALEAGVSDDAIRGLSGQAADAASLYGVRPGMGLKSQEIMDMLSRYAANPADISTARGAFPSGILSPEPASYRGRLSASYRGRLSRFTDRIYRESSPEEINFVLEGGDSTPRQMWFSNNPDTAIGQRGNTGVLAEYNPYLVEGMVDQHPGWLPAWQSGSANFTDRHLSPGMLRQALRSFAVIPKSGRIDRLGRIDKARLKGNLSRLRDLGWTTRDISDGSMAYYSPGYGA